MLDGQSGWKMNGVDEGQMDSGWSRWWVNETKGGWMEQIKDEQSGYDVNDGWMVWMVGQWSE